MKSTEKENIDFSLSHLQNLIIARKKGLVIFDRKTNYYVILKINTDKNVVLLYKCDKEEDIKYIPTEPEELLLTDFRSILSRLTVNKP